MTEPKICKYCHGSADEEGDENLGEMISPCRCSGSVKYVHRKCLNQWRNSRIPSLRSSLFGWNENIREFAIGFIFLYITHFSSFNPNNPFFVCESCKFPYQFKKKRRKNCKCCGACCCLLMCHDTEKFFHQYGSCVAYSCTLFIFCTFIFLFGFLGKWLLIQLSNPYLIGSTVLDKLKEQKIVLSSMQESSTQLFASSQSHLPRFTSIRHYDFDSITDQDVELFLSSDDEGNAAESITENDENVQSRMLHDKLTPSYFSIKENNEHIAEWEKVDPQEQLRLQQVSLWENYWEQHFYSLNEWHFIFGFILTSLGGLTHMFTFYRFYIGWFTRQIMLEVLMVQEFFYKQQIKMQGNNSPLHSLNSAIPQTVPMPHDIESKFFGFKWIFLHLFGYHSNPNSILQDIHRLDLFFCIAAVTIGCCEVFGLIYRICTLFIRQIYIVFFFQEDYIIDQDTLRLDEHMMKE